MMGRGNFWIHIKELIPQASIKQLQNLAISVMPSPGGKSFRPEVMVKQEVLLDITRRLDSIFIDSGLPFDDDHFKLVCHLADMTGYVCRYEYHIIMTPTVGSGIVPSLVKAWEAMKGSRGDAWLKDRIEIWGGAGPAPWEGNNDARRLRWLIRRAERGGRYLTRPDADAPGH
ncbi:hypothetical protein BOTBODRAFT_33944 [Botryobasidium botryosum FD-172 SS1]|uniref:Uncharacterized protein n=1 Tax=Botryobasidium botryosum (strain FD-172 SS1) TaxID=930990 RepID=A0A067MNA7_BOTB1|nr:hypothetical protein BOTBODRAFT_33944 [Botryobasidium botryosum FD-172 SS1]